MQYSSEEEGEGDYGIVEYASTRADLFARYAVREIFCFFSLFVMYDEFLRLI